MQAVNNVLKWSFFLTGITGLMLLVSVFAIWLLIEMLAILVAVTV